MDRTDLLEALAESRLFANALKDVALDKCTVRVITKVAGEIPTAEEENAGAPLELCARSACWPCSVPRATGSLFMCAFQKNTIKVCMFVVLMWSACQSPPGQRVGIGPYHSHARLCTDIYALASWKPGVICLSVVVCNPTSIRTHLSLSSFFRRLPPLYTDTVMLVRIAHSPIITALIITHGHRRRFPAALQEAWWSCMPPMHFPDWPDPSMA
jgi:hypothetical protein